VLGMVLAKQSPPSPAMWQTIVVIFTAVAVLAVFIYAADRFRER